MPLNLILTHLIRIKTTLAKLTEWLDYYGSNIKIKYVTFEGETEYEPGYVYFLETPGGHDKLKYYRFLARQNSRRRVYYEDDERAWEPPKLDRYDHWLGVITLEVIGDSEIVYKAQRHFDNYDYVWDTLFYAIVENFFPDVTNLEKIDQALIESPDAEEEEVSKQTQSLVNQQMKDDKQNQGMSELRKRRARFFRKVKVSSPYLTKAKASIIATTEAKDIIRRELETEHPGWNDELIDDEIQVVFEREWSNGKKEFTKHQVKNDIVDMGWKWSNLGKD